MQTSPYSVFGLTLVVNGAVLSAILVAPQGAGATSTNTTGACAADFNHDGEATNAELLSFLDAWLSGTSAADFNGDHTINNQDLVSFIGNWLSGCNLPACSDGIDNDADGLIDYPIDPGCASAVSGTEAASTAPRKNIYAFRHWYSLGPTSLFPPWNLSGPPQDNPYIVFPWVLAAESPESMDPTRAKRWIDSLPQGAKSFFAWSIESAYGSGDENVLHHGDDCRTPGGSIISGVPCPWLDNWLGVVEPRVRHFAEEYRRIGGEADVLTMDMEAWSKILNDTAEYRSIVASDPRFSSYVNARFQPSELPYGPLQQRLGNLNWFFPGTLRDSCPGYFCAQSYAKFFQSWADTYMNEAVFKPFRSSFPNLKASNFLSFYHDFENYWAPFDSAIDHCMPGLWCQEGRTIFGNYNQPRFGYDHDVPGAGTLKLDGQNLYPRTDFNSFKASVNQLKVVYLSNPAVRLAPLFGGQKLYASGPTPLQRNLYSEMVLHALLSGADWLNYWDPEFDAENAAALSNTIAEFLEIAGTIDRRELFPQDSRWLSGMQPSNKSSWSEDFVVTGMSAGGRKVWRLTTDTYPAGAGLEHPIDMSNILISETASGVVFRTLQKTIAFERGVIWRPANPVSHEGWWIVQPADAPDYQLGPSGLNRAPFASMSLLQGGHADYAVIVNAIGSFDSDGHISRYYFDFDGDGVFGNGFDTFGDPIYNQGGVMTAEEANNNPPPPPPLGPRSTAFFTYTYGRPGTYSVALKLIDDRGAQTVIRSAPFTFPRARCPNPSEYIGEQCPISQASSGE